MQGTTLCKECFFATFEEDVHNTIKNNKLFVPGDVVAIGASGGKGLYSLKINYYKSFYINKFTIIY